MKTKKHIILNANQAVANVAYKTNEVFPIYPITPASEMSELVEQWSAESKLNNFDSIPTTFEMQSEAGVAGAMHGALQTGSLSSTFTASQGLLLMLPNMYKIAGELTPNVIHVATRSIATHALSVYGDHSDIMACRQSGYAFLGSSSVQEAQDFALIAQAATLKSRIPFVHFFDGFRTSHEFNTIESLLDDTINSMMDSELIDAHRNRALNPNNPVIKGTSQGPDVFFQSREAVNSYYNDCPSIVQNQMKLFEKLTGRTYNLFDYVGHSEAEHVLVSMASSTATIENAIKILNEKGEKFGLVKVRLFRPFSTKHLLKSIPTSCKNIAVLDRTKEPGSTGEPLYLDVLQSVTQAYQDGNIDHFPRIIGGRYGLSSKEFTPKMVQAIFDNLKELQPIKNFTVGIHDDISHLSLDCSRPISNKINTCQAVFYQSKPESNSERLRNALELLTKQKNIYVQSYTEIDYKKSNLRNVTHLRINDEPINEPYLIENADFVACQDVYFTLNDNAIKTIKLGGTLLVNTSLSSKAFWHALSANIKYQIIEKEVQLYIINSLELNQSKEFKKLNINELHACFLALRNDGLTTEDNSRIKDFIYKVDSSIPYSKNEVTVDQVPEFSETLLGQLLGNNGNRVPISLLPEDGTFPSDTSKYNPIVNRNSLPVWNFNSCTQCGACSLSCPQAALRIKTYKNELLNAAPKTFKSVDSIEPDWELDLLNYTIQVNPDQCNGCNNCIDSCPSNALNSTSDLESINEEKNNWEYFESIPEMDRNKIDSSKLSQQQLQEPLFKYSIGVEGCGEAPYLKLISQLFGDRLLVANATGSSSIIGGALPTTPWSKNKNGQGPAWSNSLFEDNAEFGLGYRLSLNNQELQAKILLEKLRPHLDFDLVHDTLNASQITELEISEQRSRVNKLKQVLQYLDLSHAKKLLKTIDALVQKSVWIVGGDGWAYDIGFGGLDHVIASGENVNILVLDNEVYDNTGGQSSKATPFGSKAKFAFKGKLKQKKDLGLYAMNYDNVYVASVSIGANQEQTLKAFKEAESFDGPSIIIAYTHSKSHGIDMKNPIKYHKAAVDSGQWLLYRNDPRNIKNGQSSLQLDSCVPSIKIEEYLKLENRFSEFFNKDSQMNNIILQDYQKHIDKRFDQYLNKANSPTVNRNKLIQNLKIRNSQQLKS